MTDRTPALIPALRQAFARGATTPQALARAAIAAAQGDPQSGFAALDIAGAEAQAARAATLIAQGSDLPLLGLPLAHKDMFDRAGRITGYGAHPSAGRRAAGTSTVLARLDAAGQVDLGRLRMSEFALGPTGHNHHHGLPANPAAPGRITGGSSSGSGAAVAAGLVVAALGSDTGGSIRLPAACCGVVGLKPTQGSLPMDGVMPLSFTQDCVGPLARSVADAWTVWCALSGAAPDLPDSNGIRLGFDAGGFVSDCAPDVAAMLAEVRALAPTLGCTARTLDLGWWSDLTEPANVIAMSEGAAVHADRLRAVPDSYGPQVRARLVQALGVPAPAYLRALQLRRIGQARMQALFAEVDAIVLPTLPFAPPLAADVDIADRPGMAAVVGQLARLTRPASILGLPALSLPVARTDQGPLSLQIVGPYGSEAQLCALAHKFERAFALVRPVVATDIFAPMLQQETA
jgi:aspartyl-tRNA(Asn)/glutamyl-tRNA(Gln) amidotransferase subunit A